MKNIEFGAVYFRKTAPLKEEWEKDYKQAKEDGLTLFRHWFCWNSIEVAEGAFDWEDYDAQLDLGLKHGIKTVIAEMSIDTPEWLNARLYGNGSIIDAAGVPKNSQMHNSSATGGHYCLCYDNPEVKAYTDLFLKELALRYKDHPALLGYDVFNECTLYSPDRLCYCEHTNQKFVKWLKNKYQDLSRLCRAWGRFSYSDWSQIKLPKEFGPYAECMDAITFWNENTFANMQEKINVIKTYDPNHKIIAHGNARSFNDIATCCGDDFRASQCSDVFGYTYYYGTACNPFLAGDLIRGASDGKEFWRAEAVGNSDYEGRNPSLEPQTQKDNAADPEYIRFDALTSIACGATAYMTPRYRPLLSGPLAGAFGWYGLDGGKTKRSEEIKKLNEWCNQDCVIPLWKAKPTKSDIAILIVEESQAFSYLFGQFGRYQDYYNHMYSMCIQGIYQAFLDSNIACDFIKFDQLDSYRILYLAYPLALSDQQISMLSNWVKQGGCLITEAGFGYFDEKFQARLAMRCSEIISLFGAVPKELVMAPDRFNNLTFSSENGTVCGGIYKQEIDNQEGKILGWFEDSSTAGVLHHCGKGTVVALGTMVSYGYYRHKEKNTRNFIQTIYQQLGGISNIQISDSRLILKQWSSEQARFLWIVNPTNEMIYAKVLRENKVLNITNEMLLRTNNQQKDNDIAVNPKDAVVIVLKECGGELG